MPYFHFHCFCWAPVAPVRLQWQALLWPQFRIRKSNTVLPCWSWWWWNTDQKAKVHGNDLRLMQVNMKRWKSSGSIYFVFAQYRCRHTPHICHLFYIFCKLSAKNCIYLRQKFIQDCVSVPLRHWDWGNLGTKYVWLFFSFEKHVKVSFKPSVKLVVEIRSHCNANSSHWQVDCNDNSAVFAHCFPSALLPLFLDGGNLLPHLDCHHHQLFCRTPILWVPPSARSWLKQVTILTTTTTNTNTIFMLQLKSNVTCHPGLHCK